VPLLRASALYERAKILSSFFFNYFQTGEYEMTTKSNSPRVLGYPVDGTLPLAEDVLIKELGAVSKQVDTKAEVELKQREFRTTIQLSAQDSRVTPAELANAPWLLARRIASIAGTHKPIKRYFKTDPTTGRVVQC
jgi:hypothetical protein